MTTSRQIGDNQYESSLTIIGQDGVPHTQVLDANVYSDLHLAPGGGVYEAVLYGEFRSYQTRLLMIRPDGTTVSSQQVVGYPVAEQITIGADGVAYQPVVLEQANAAGEKGVVMVVQPDGTTTTFGIIGQIVGAPVVTADGTIYQTSGALENAPAAVYVTTIHPDGSVEHSEPISGYPAGAVTVTSDGTVLVTIAHQDERTTVGVLDADGSIRIVGEYTGYSNGPVVMGPGGVAYVSTSTGTYTVDPSAAQSV